MRSVTYKDLVILTGILLQDPILLNRVAEFSDSLGIPPVYFIQQQSLFRTGLITFYGILHGLLEQWISRNGFGASIEILIIRLKGLQLIHLAEIIEQEFLDNSPGRLQAQGPGVQLPPLEIASLPSIVQRGIRIRQRIDVGSYGEIFSIICADGKQYALKKVSIAKFIANTGVHQEGTEYIKKLLREVDTMSKIDNPTNVVQYYGSWFDGPLSQSIQDSLQSGRPLLPIKYEHDASGKPILGESEEKTYLLIQMEYCNLNLQQWIGENPIPGRLSKVPRIIRHLLQGLAVLHRNGIIHRDLKPNNVLIKMMDYDYVVKIADFGVARDISTESALTGNVGYDTFRSPEMVDVRSGVNYGYKTDIWSLGIIYLLLLHNFESDRHEQHAILSLSLGKREVFDDFKIKGITDDHIHYLESMLKVDPSKRLDADTLLDMLR